MTEKSNIQVIINGKILNLSGFESEEYLQKVASYINKKIHELNEETGNRRLSADLKAILVQINIADDMLKAKRAVEQLETDLRQKENELAELRHRLVHAELKLEKLDEENIRK